MEAVRLFLWPDHIHAEIKSSTDPGKIYDVFCANGAWVCTCPDFRYNGRACKHIVQITEQLLAVMSTQAA